MKVLEIEVKDHPKFRLSPRMKHFKYRPGDNVEILLAQNGAGKSSIYRILMPVPEPRASLTEPGSFVRQRYEHNDRIYELMMIHNNKVRYSFKIDDTELNTSGLYALQVDLVYEHFKLDIDIVDMLLGKSNFTFFNAASIKKWVTKLSTTDFTFIMGVYQGVRKNLTYVNNIIKHENKKLIAYEQDNSEEGDTLKKELKDLKSRLDYFIDLKEPLTQVNEPDKVSVDTIEESTLKYKKLMEEIECDDIEELDEWIRETEETIALNADRRATIAEQLSSLNNDIESKDITTIPDRDLLEEKRSKLLPIASVEPREDISSYASAFGSVIEPIRSLLKDLPNDKMPMSIDEHKAIKVEAAGISDTLHGVNAKLNEQRPRLLELEHLKEHDLIKCPSCKHEFYTRYDGDEHELLIRNIDKLNKQRELLEEKLDNAKELYARYAPYMEAYGHIQHLAERNRVLKGVLWDEVYKALYSDIASIPPMLDKLSQELNAEINSISAREEMKVIDSYIEVHDAKANTDVSLLEKMRDKYAEDLDTIQKVLDEARPALDRYINIRKSYHKQAEMLKGLKEYLGDIRNYHSYDIKSKVQAIINDEIRVIKTILYEKESRLNNIINKEEAIQTTKDTLTEYMEEKEVLLELFRDISPENGLIGNVLNTFVSQLIHAMNRILNRIWTNEFNINPLDMKNGALVYNFSAKIGNNNIPTIKDCSSGERDLINLAFKIVAMNILGMNSYPLILDEIGMTLDNVHRKKLYDYISKDLTQRNYSNIYLTSHFEELYEVFPDDITNVVVLDTTNVKTKGLTISNNLTPM